MKNFIRALAVVPVIVGAAFVACSSDETGSSSGSTPDSSTPTTDSATDGGTDSSTVPDAPTGDAADAGSDGACAPYTGALPNDAGAMCHDLVNSAPAIPVTVGSGAIPVGTGGTLADGLYHVTELRTYPGSPAPTNITVKYTVLVKGDITYAVNDNSNEASTQRKITKTNPDGGPNIELCNTKSSPEPIDTSHTATCTGATSYNSTFLYSTTVTKQ